MAITYPLDLPSNTDGIATARLSARSVVARTRSAFTGQEQVQVNQGQWWQLDVTMVPQLRSEAAEWDAFLMKLNGGEGTFLAGDPAGQTPRGTATAEGASTNVVLQSQTFQTTWSTIQSSVSTNTASAPNGEGATADSLIENSATNQHGISQAVASLDSSLTWVGSVYIKANTRDVARLQVLVSGSLIGAIFDVAGTPSVVSSGAIGNATLSSASVENVGSGWIRCKVVGQIDSAGGTGTTITHRIHLLDGTAGHSATTTSGYTGDGSSSFYIWGAQLEQSSTVTSYLATTTTSVSRPAGPYVDGGSQTGNSLDTGGWTPSVTNILRAADYIQIGTGANTRLHKVLNDVNSDFSGKCTLDIWPKLRASPVDEELIIKSNTKGLFRLDQNEHVLDISPRPIYRINFTASEVL